MRAPAWEHPRYLFHGTCSHVEGPHLNPVMPCGDAGDPQFPVVFASDRLDFAALFSAKTRAVSHISAGSCPPYLILTDEKNNQADAGQVFVLPGVKFTPVLVDGTPSGKWYSPNPVPIFGEQAIRIRGRSHLVDLGVVMVYARADRDGYWSAAARISQALQEPRSPAQWWDSLMRLTQEGAVAHYEGLKADHRASPAPLEAAVADISQGGSLNVQLERFFDTVVVKAMEPYVRVRLTHGIDHACRTSLLCRILHNLLMSAGVIQALSPLEMAGLMVCAFFHDAARRSDVGADDSSAASASCAEQAMLTLGFSRAAAQLARQRILHEADAPWGTLEVGTAILQSADALELMRNYSGDIWLTSTSLYALLHAQRPSAVSDFVRLAQNYADWLRSLRVWGLARGHVRGPQGKIVITSSGPIFDPVGVFRRNLDRTPLSTIRATLRQIPLLEQLYEL